MCVCVQVQVHSCVIQLCVCYCQCGFTAPPLHPHPLGQLGGSAGQKGLVKAASSSCNPKGYSLLTDTCSELTEHFLLQNMYTLHLADTLYPLGLNKCTLAVAAALNLRDFSHTAASLVVQTQNLKIYY